MKNSFKMKLSILAAALMTFLIMSCNQEESIAFEKEIDLDDIVSQLSQDDLFHDYLSILHKYEASQDILNEYIDLTEAELNSMDGEQVMSIVESMYGFNSPEELDNYYTEIANIQAKINEKFFVGRELNESEITYIFTNAFALEINKLSSVNGRLDNCLARAGTNYGERLDKCRDASLGDSGTCYAWADLRYRLALSMCYAFNSQ